MDIAISAVSGSGSVTVFCEYAFDFQLQPGPGETPAAKG
jgi:hypothetical protein